MTRTEKVSYPKGKAGNRPDQTTGRYQKVFSRREEVCHVWASRTQQTGKSGNIFFEGERIYSYGYHFCLAEFKKMPNGETIVLINAGSSSVTTTRHLLYVRRSLDGLNYRIVYLPTESTRSLISPKDNWLSYSDGKKYYIQEIQDYFDKASRARENVAHLCNIAKGYIVRLYVWGLLHKRKARYVLTTSDKAIIKRAEKYAEKMAERLKAERAKADAYRGEKRIALIAACGGDIAAYWHTHGQVPKVEKYRFQYYDFPETLCRISDDGTEVVTTRQARVPVDHARRIIPIVARCRRNHTGYKAPPDAPIRIGHYALNEIMVNGDITIGCHRIKWSEVEYIGEQLGIF